MKFSIHWSRLTGPLILLRIDLERWTVFLLGQAFSASVWVLFMRYNSYVTFEWVSICDIKPENDQKLVKIKRFLTQYSFSLVPTIKSILVMVRGNLLNFVWKGLLLFHHLHSIIHELIIFFNLINGFWSSTWDRWTAKNLTFSDRWNVYIFKGC